MQVVPTPVGRFLYYPTRDTNLAQLRQAKVVSVVDEKRLEKKKPDGLIVVPNGKVVAVIEYKQPHNLKTPANVKKAIQQELEVARSLCKLLIVSDNTKTYWINALTGNVIVDEDGAALNRIVDVRDFQNNSLTTEKIKEIEALIDKIDVSVTEQNDTLRPPEQLDPTPLARSLWQKIWVSTGKEPEKCLYNVVELFVFKFLSDLGVLKDYNNFSAIYKIRRTSSEDALRHYAAISRTEIKSLFPAGDDRTTIINGTIFVNEKGEANTAQASLFADVLDQLERFDRANGSFRYIQRDFKTRLYESFLRQSAGVKSLGQYFTPRNVVRAMVEMSPASQLPPNARICDPFCGVGGFLLETIADVKKIYDQFEPQNGQVKPIVTLVGYDKGSDEKDDERTIILAKANMLIYFSELIAKHHSHEVLKEFSNNAFNKVFKLLRSNLGTFAERPKEAFDLILTNPPYVTSGVSSLRRAIIDANLADQYTVSGRGTEALSIEWIVRNLKEGGHALVVVPDGLLTQTAVLDFISEKCFVQCIAALPTRTFYSTPKKTFILVLRRKEKHEKIQQHPTLAYIVGEIGETRDAYRFPIKQNDLTELVGLYNQYNGSPNTFTTTADRCKLIPAKELLTSRHWLVERWWSDEEKRALGIVETNIERSTEDFMQLAGEARKALVTLEKSMPATAPNVGTYVTITLGGDWMEFISSQTSWTRTQYRKIDTGVKEHIPVYSAARLPVAYVQVAHKSLITATPEAPVISFAANGDGSAGTNFVFHTRKFYVSNDRTCIRIRDANIDPEYVLYALGTMKETYGFNHSFKAVRKNLENVTLEVPWSDGAHDIATQRRIVDRYKKMTDLKTAIREQLEALDTMRVAFG